MPEEKPIASSHETRDINARALAWFGAGLAIALLVVFIAIRGMTSLFDGQLRSASPAPTGARLPAPPPGPRLQSNPASDMERFRQSEDAILNTYGWVDRQAGLVRIPIERAMDLVVQRGLPASQANSGKTPLQMRQEKAAEEKKSP